MREQLKRIVVLALIGLPATLVAAYLRRRMWRSMREGVKR